MPKEKIIPIDKNFVKKFCKEEVLPSFDKTVEGKITLFSHLDNISQVLTASVGDEFGMRPGKGSFMVDAIKAGYMKNILKSEDERTARSTAKKIGDFSNILYSLSTLDAEKSNEEAYKKKFNVDTKMLGISSGSMNVNYLHDCLVSAKRDVIDGDKLSPVENKAMDMMIDVTEKYMQAMSKVNPETGQLPPKGKNRK